MSKEEQPPQKPREPRTRDEKIMALQMSLLRTEGSVGALVALREAINKNIDQLQESASEMAEELDQLQKKPRLVKATKMPPPLKNG